ncbi:MAG TPA: hypothetical protein PKJ10_02570 [Smithella sp.]|nr:hypothetical protein [Smithella sp.]
MSQSHQEQSSSAGCCHPSPWQSKDLPQASVKIIRKEETELRLSGSKLSARFRSKQNRSWRHIKRDPRIISHGFYRREILRLAGVAFCLIATETKLFKIYSL